MFTQTKKKCSIFISLFLVFGFIIPAYAGDFSDAMNYVFSSNAYFASAIYYFFIAADYDSLGIDSTDVYNTGLQNLNLAIDSALNAYNSANTGYAKNPNTVNQYAKDTANYDFYYKYQFRNWLFSAEESGFEWYLYLANYWHGYAAYWTGLASNGGYN